MIRASKAPGNRLNLTGFNCSPVCPSTKREGRRENGRKKKVVDGDKGERVRPVKTSRLTGLTVATRENGRAPGGHVIRPHSARRLKSEPTGER
jgi:hypothetical protein